MDIIEVNGNWEQQKRELKIKFAALTESDLLFLEEKKEEMITRLQSKLGKTKEELYKIIKSL